MRSHSTVPAVKPGRLCCQPKSRNQHPGVTPRAGLTNPDHTALERADQVCSLEPRCEDMEGGWGEGEPGATRAPARCLQVPPGTTLSAESTNSQHFLRAHSGPKRCVSTFAAHTITAARGPCAVPQILSCILLFVAHRAPLSMGGPRQEYWSGLPFPPREDIRTQGSNPCLIRPLHCRWILYH